MSNAYVPDNIPDDDYEEEPEKWTDVDAHEMVSSDGVECEEGKRENNGAPPTARLHVTDRRRPSCATEYRSLLALLEAHAVSKNEMPLHRDAVNVHAIGGRPWPGNFALPDEDRGLWLQLLHLSRTRLGGAAFLSERASEIAAFMVDFDLKLSRGHGYVDITRPFAWPLGVDGCPGDSAVQVCVRRVMDRVMRQWFPDSKELQCIFYTASGPATQYIDTSTGERVAAPKTSFSIVWPSVVQTRDVRLCLAEAMRKALRDACPGEGGDQLADAVDLNIYGRGGGSRMLYSDKYGWVQCSDCRDPTVSRSRANLRCCRDSGGACVEEEAQRPLVPFAAYRDSDGQLDEVSSMQWARVARWSLIRRRDDAKLTPIAGDKAEVVRRCAEQERQRRGGATTAEAVAEGSDEWRLLRELAAPLEISSADTGHMDDATPCYFLRLEQGQPCPWKALRLGIEPTDPAVVHGSSTQSLLVLPTCITMTPRMCFSDKCRAMADTEAARTKPLPDGVGRALFGDAPYRVADIVEAADNGHRGMASLFCRAVGDAVKVVDVGDGTCYNWHAERRLWQPCAANWLIAMVSKVLGEYTTAAKDAAAAALCRARAAVERDAEADDKDALNKEVKRRGAIVKARQKLHLEASSTPYARNVLTQAYAMLYDRTFQEKIDHPPDDLLPVRGGLVVDLRTGEARERTVTDTFTFECPVGVPPGGGGDEEGRKAVAQCDSDCDEANDGPAAQWRKWQQRFPDAARFFRDVACQDVRLAHYLVCVCGYFLTGHTSERCVFVWYGRGRNGKSTLCGMLERVLGVGHFFGTLDKAVLIRHRETGAGAASPHLMALKGPRLAMGAESSAGQHLNDDVIKNVSGDDLISMRPLYGKPQQVRVHAKCVLQTNHRPLYDTTDQAMADRLVVVPFKARFVDAPAGVGAADDNSDKEHRTDADFVERLKSDGGTDEIFALLVEGAKEWYNNERRLPPKPQAVVEAEQSYTTEQDTVQQFLDERCDVAPMAKRAFGGEMKTMCKVLYDAFCAWHKEEHATDPYSTKRPMSKAEFATNLSSKGFRRFKNSTYYFAGVRLHSNDGDQ